MLLTLIHGILYLKREDKRTPAMGKNEEEKIGEGLVRIGAMTRAQVDEILALQKAGNDSLFGIMAMEMGYVDPETLMKYLESRERE